MNNKTTKICCTLVILSSIAATPAFSQVNFTGLSGAIGVGYERAKDTLTDDTPETFNLKKNNWISVLDLSYGIQASKDLIFSLGGTYSLTNSKTKTTDISGKLKDHYSVYLEPTYLLNDKTGVFLNLSYNKAKDTMAATDGTTLSENVSAYGYGVGIKNFVDKNLFIKAQLNHINYGTEITVDSTGATVTIKPKTTTALISIGYKF